MWNMDVSNPVNQTDIVDLGHFDLPDLPDHVNHVELFHKTNIVDHVDHANVHSKKKTLLDKGWWMPDHRLSGRVMVGEMKIRLNSGPLNGLRF